MSSLASPILLFAASVIGALGIALALPRRGVSPQLLGALIAALGLGGIFLALGLRSPKALPNINFYIFSLIALGSALRVISHPRPVYSALYFILTILASSGLYVLLSAEFMAFALVIVYAGAILITYLFVIMLATEGPTADQVESLADYDRYSREPLVATITGFVLLAGLTTMLGLGSSRLTPAETYAGASRLEMLPGKIEESLARAGVLDTASETIARDPATGRLMLEFKGGELMAFTKQFGNTTQRVVRPTPAAGSDAPVKWPTDLRLSNVEGVGFTLLADHPGGIEIAGVVLLMAMLGAVVLARKKVELDEQAKLTAQQRALIDEAGERSMREVARVAPAAASPTPIIHGGATKLPGSGGIGGNGRGSHVHGGAAQPSGGGGGGHR